MPNPFLKASSAGLLMTIAAVLITLLTQSASGQAPPVNTLVFTEKSNTILDATYNGSPLSVTFVNSDFWHVTIPSTTFSTPALWLEPDPGPPFFANFVAPLVVGGSALGIGSDSGPVAGGHPDGFTITNFGTDSSNGGSISVTFYDRGDIAAAVPDTGTTASLFGFSLAGLAFLRRKLA